MASTGSANLPTNASQLRDDWLRRLRELLVSVAAWAAELGWTTRQITKRMEDAETGSYEAPALLFQRETVQLLLEPIARTAPGAEGVVDLYLMPAYDDIASLYLVKGRWQLHYMFPGQPTVATIRNAESKTLSKETLASVLEAMKQNAV